MNGKAPTNDKVNKVMFALSLITVEQSSSFFLPLLSWETVVELILVNWLRLRSIFVIFFYNIYGSNFGFPGKHSQWGRCYLSWQQARVDQGFFKKEDPNKSVRRSISSVAFSHQCDTGCAIHLNMLKKSAQTSGPFDEEVDCQSCFDSQSRSSRQYGTTFMAQNEMRCRPVFETRPGAVGGDPDPSVRAVRHW